MSPEQSCIYESSFNLGQPTQPDVPGALQGVDIFVAQLRFPMDLEPRQGSRQGGQEGEHEEVHDGSSLTTLPKEQVIDKLTALHLHTYLSIRGLSIASLQASEFLLVFKLITT